PVCIVRPATEWKRRERSPPDGGLFELVKAVSLADADVGAIELVRRRVIRANSDDLVSGMVRDVHQRVVSDEMGERTSISAARSNCNGNLVEIVHIQRGCKRQERLRVIAVRTIGYVEALGSQKCDERTEVEAVVRAKRVGSSETIKDDVIDV